MKFFIKNHPKKSFLDSSVGKIYQSNCCKISTENNVKALVLPHAGSVFVKQVMDYSFSLIDQKDFKSVLLLTANHSDAKNYTFPASQILHENDIEIDVRCFHSKTLTTSETIFYQEHSFLSVMPYLNHLKLPVTILVVGGYDQNLIEDIMREMDESTLLVTNTDLLHCGPSFGTECPSDIEDFNRKTLKKILKNDFSGMRNRLCGRAAVESFSKIVKRLKFFYTEYGTTSSDVIANNDANSVGYCSILYNKTGRANLENNEILSNLPKEVLTQNIKFYFSLHIRKIVGLFVTITKNNILRGCVGSFKLDKKDLLKGIEKYSFLAAFSDKRFNPVEEAELPLLTFSLTFLEKPFVVSLETLFDSFVVGTHGLTIYFKDGRSATYLAKVITEHFRVNTSLDFKNKFQKIENSLKKKANSRSAIRNIEIYKCIEI